MPGAQGGGPASSEQTRNLGEEAEEGEPSLPEPESPAAACRLGCSEACGVSAPQPETERTAPHCRADSEPLDHQESPSF